MKKIYRKTKPVLFHNEDFQTIQVRLFFPFKRDEKQIAMMYLLPGMLHHVCSLYPTEREYTLELQKRFILSCYCSSSTFIQDSYFQFQLTIPDIYSLKQDLLEEQFQFFSEMIYHPKMEDNHFCLEEFQREVDNLKVDIDKTLKDTGSYAYIKAREIVEPDSEFSDTIYNHQEQIDLVTPEDLYQFYCDTIYNNQPFIYVFGNVDEKRIENLCHRYLYRIPITKQEFDVQMKHYLPIHSSVKDVVEKSSFRNSVYSMFYKVQDMQEEDEILLGVIQSLLSSQSSRLLSQKLRSDYDLVYSASSTNSSSYGLLSIVAFIHKNNIQIIKEKILEVLEDLKKEDIITPCLENIKERNRISLIRQLDDKYTLFRDAIIKDLGIDFTNQEYHEKLMKVTPKDVVSFMNRLVLDTQYFLEEGEHE